MSLPIKIKLPAHFLDEELRCGYTVTNKLKKIWAVELDLLNELLRVCKKYNIKPIVFGGTLLGAVRHQGFIPWDDDLDVALTREDFEKLCEIAPAEFAYPYFFQTAISDRRYFFAYARLRNSETTGAISYHMTSGYNNGIYIDIYVLEGYVESKIRWYFQNLLMKLALKAVTLYYQKVPRVKGFKERLLRIPRPFVILFRYEIWLSIYRKILGLYTKTSRRIGLRDEMSRQAQRYWVYKNELADIIELPFENILVPVPRSYDEVLRRVYGDYMGFPPVSARGKWHSGQIIFDPDVPYKDYIKNRCKNII